MALDFARGFLSSQTSRRVAFGYVLVLHLLAFGGLLELVSSDGDYDRRR